MGRPLLWTVLLIQGIGFDGSGSDGLFGQGSTTVLLVPQQP
jgi:hypothetical protein